MSDLIITDQGTKEVLKRIRSPKIIIQNPESGNKAVIFHAVEATYEDGVFVGEKRVGSVSKSLDEAAMLADIVFTDPITQQEVTLKVATVAAAVENYFVSLWNDREA